MWESLFRLGLVGALFSITALVSCSDQVSEQGEEKTLSVGSVDAPNETLDSLNEEVSLVPVYAERRQDWQIGGPGFVMFLRSQLAAPQTDDGTILSANYVKRVGKFLYVAYHEHGEGSTGAIDILNVQNSNWPRLVSRLIISNADINTLAVGDEGSLYFAGGAAEENSLETPAFVASLALPDDRELADVALDVWDVPSYSVNSLLFDGSSALQVACGSTGGAVGLLDVSDGSWSPIVEQSNTKSLITNGEEVVNSNGDVTGLDGATHTLVLRSGEDANVAVYSYGENPSLERSIDIGALSPADGKSMLWVDGDHLWVPMLENGVQVVNWTDGSAVYDFGAEYFGGDNAAAVVKNDDAVFIAAGSAGLYAMDMSDADDPTSWQVDDFGASVNHLAVSGNMIYVAAGTEGLKIYQQVGN